MFLNCLLFCLLILATAETVADYYELLGISKDADNREIRKAFKKLALQFHPDKNQDKNTHEKFIAINKAYEVLKNEETRKKYDQFGEEGLKEDFGQSWKGNYHSWNYYYESFGIYDDDPEIITFSKRDFDQSVLDSSDLWFVNFYSPQCSHCHHLAPAWRELARELKGVIRIGAVNCEEDWALCRRQNVYSYPSLIFYPQKEKYQGPREADVMIDFVLEKLPFNVIQLKSSNFLEQVSREEYSRQPWLIFICKDTASCFDRSDLQKLGIILEHLANIAEVEGTDDAQICDLIDCKSSVTYYTNLSDNLQKSERKMISIEETDIQDISKKVFQLLPEATVLTDIEFQEMQSDLRSLTSSPWLMRFTNGRDGISENEMDLKRIKAFLPDIKLGQLDCNKFKSTCSQLYIKKYPAFALFKPGGTYEFHYGRITAYDVARFAREALSSQVHTLTPEHFPAVVESGETWFIDFFAPWCPPCMQLLPEWRKASYSAGNSAKFGTVDCTTHEGLCQKYKINSFPTTILYNQSVPHQFHGAHSHSTIVEFIQDILHPSVLSLSPDTFKINVKGNRDDVWIIDFYAPWCSPCQQLAPEWRKLAKMLKKNPTLHVADIDCQAHQGFCSSVDVNSYPTIRLYPKGRRNFYTYNGWSRDADSVHAWIFQYMPSSVLSLSEADFNQVLSDTEPWLIDFYAPWCGHCNMFAPKFEEVSQILKGKVKTGKINCDEERYACNRASVRAYPTVLLYAGKKSDRSQSPADAEEIPKLSPDAIVKFTEKKLRIKISEKHRKDEL